MQIGKFSRNNLQPIEITLDGVKMTKYVLSNDDCTADGANLTCPVGGRGLIHNTNYFDVTNPDFFKPELLSSVIEWDVDLSGTECGTIAQFTAVSMPAKLPFDGKSGLSISDGLFYCDSVMGEFGGTECPEMTLMEANKHILSTSAHVCDEPDENGHYKSCDWHGAGKNTADEEDGFGPGPKYKIDTTKPFNVKVYLGEPSHDEFGYFNTVLSQGKEGLLVFNSNDEDYLKLMSDEVRDGLVFAISSWQGDDRWLR